MALEGVPMEKQLAVVGSYRAGMALKDIYAEHEVSSYIVNRIFERHGVVKRRNKAVPLTPEVSRRIAEMMADGASHAAIMTETGASQASIVKHARRHGVPPRERGECTRRWPLNHHAFEELTDVAAYWLGMLLADGCVSPNRSSVRLKLKGSDHEHVAAFARFCGGVSEQVLVRDERGPDGVMRPSAVCEISSTAIREKLIGYGVTPRKTDTAAVHSDLADNRFFWLGEIDGDGTYPDVVDERALVSLLGTRAVCQAFADWVLAVVGGKPITVDRRPTGKIYSAAVSGRRALRLMQVLYRGHGLGLPRKRRMAETILERFGYSIDGPDVKYEVASRFRCVWYEPRNTNRPWKAVIYYAKRDCVTVGFFATEEEAHHAQLEAEALKEKGGRVVPPSEREEQAPRMRARDSDKAPSAAQAARKNSQFWFVKYNPKSTQRPWEARVAYKQPDGKHKVVFVGSYVTEEEAHQAQLRAEALKEQGIELPPARERKRLGIVV